MGIIKYEGYHKYAKGKRLIVYWGLGDGDNGSIDETYGLEIEVEEYHRKEEYWNVVNVFTFGYESWSQELWEKWGSYVYRKISEFPQTEEGFEAAKAWLMQVDCMYTRDDNHLRDVEMLWELVNK